MSAVPPITTLILAVLLGGCLAPSRLEQFLEATETHYSPDHHMVATEWQGPTYHTRIQRGTRVHATVDSLDYALALLHRDADGDRVRANEILATVLALQETRAANDYYGIWPWFLEEPIAAMHPPDRNWADFCGARLAQVLIDHGDKLDATIRAQTRRSLGHAARAILERDVSPSYTNIAVMGSGVAIAAGEQLGDPNLLRYGREKLEAVIAHTARTGNFQEYNSPTYTLVVLWECERALHLVTDRASRAAAEAIRRIAWRTIAQSYHPATGQWAGPHSRAYSDRLTRGIVHELAARVDRDLEVHPAQLGSKLYPFWTTPSLPCPPPWIAEFDHKAPHELHRRFRLADSEHEAVHGTTWMAGDACLGSVNRASLWQQRRPLIGYWRTAADPAIVLRLRALKDGRDFAAIGVRSQQRGAHVTSRFFVMADRGEWHRHLDKPTDSTYRARDLRIRYELRGRGVSARRMGEGRFELRAGGHRAVLRTTPGEFYGRPISFEVGQTDDLAFVDAVLHDGAEKSFDFRVTGLVGLRIRLEILSSDAPAAPR